MKERKSEKPIERPQTQAIRAPMPLAERKRLLAQTEPEAPKDSVYSDWASIWGQYLGPASGASV